MFKRIILTILALVLCFLFVSCSKEKPILDQSLHEKITISKSNGKDEYIVYQDTIYYLDKYDLFYLGTHSSPNESKNEDILLSWNGSRFAYTQTFYSDTTESPLFIYEKQFCKVYLREDYDFKSDIFVIAGTNSKIVFSDAITENAILEVFPNYDVPITIYSEQCPRLRFDTDVFFYEGNWYVTNGVDAFAITDKFVDLLIQNDIIEE